MKNKAYGIRKYKDFFVFDNYSFLVLLLRRFGSFGLSWDSVDADQGGRAGVNWEGQFLISGSDDGFPQRSRNQRRDSVFSNGVAKDAIIGVAIFMAFIVSVLFAFFSVLFVLS